MKKWLVLAIVAVIALPLKPQILPEDCISPGCFIVLKHTAFFVQNPETCEWEYVSGIPSGGHVTVRGRSERFKVIKIEENEVLAYGEIFFGLEKGMFLFDKSVLSDQKLFSIHTSNSG